jgi:transposase
MSERCPAYPPEFRQPTVALVRAGRSPEEPGREFEPSAQAIRNWVALAGRDEGRRGDGLTGAEREELGRLRRENPRPHQEREILAKDAMGRATEEHGSIVARGHGEVGVPHGPDRSQLYDQAAGRFESRQNDHRRC